MKYSADLGCWEKGIVEVFDAKDRDAALKEAYRLLQEAEKDGSLPKDSCVVQMFCEGKCIYDYMNGFYDRRASDVSSV